MFINYFILKGFPLKSFDIQDEIEFKGTEMFEALLGIPAMQNVTLVTGQAEWGAGVYNFIVPEGVYSVCGDVLGAGGASFEGSGWAIGGGAGGGGGRAWENDIMVVPGEILTITVGGGLSNKQVGANTSIVRKATSEILLMASCGGTGSRYSGGVRGYGMVGANLLSGGAGGHRGDNCTIYGGGGGAAGYSGSGGNGARYQVSGGSNVVSLGPTAGAGGGGGGGGLTTNYVGILNFSGGGAGIRGVGLSGATGAPGKNGSVVNGSGAYGHGQSGIDRSSGPGRARLIWGPQRAYPSKNLLDL